MLNVCECHSEDFWVFEWTRKKPCWRASQKTLAKRPKMFRSSWNFFEQNAKILQSMYRKEKNFPVKFYQKINLDTRKAVGKSSLQKFLLKSFIYFSENRKKPQNLELFFKFLLSSKLILWTERIYFHNSTLDS